MCLTTAHTPGEHTAPDPELERKLREMEANQLNAWEEKEKLSQALEAERQANMNNVISEMMNSVKEQKVQHMKNIKRLTNEKALLTSQFKESKEANVKLKSNLDVNIQKYQVRPFDVWSAMQSSHTAMYLSLFWGMPSGLL
jgi:hypothetical protein